MIKHRKWLKKLLYSSLFQIVLGFGFSGLVQATTTTLGSGQCTETNLDSALADSQVDRIEFQCPGETIVITGEKAITRNLSLIGPVNSPSSPVRINGDNQFRIFNISGIGVAVEIENLILEFAAPTSLNPEGGAILVTNASLSVTGSSFESNDAAFGGAIHNEGGSVQVRSSTFTLNHVSSFGGAISNDNGDLDVANSTFVLNDSGGNAGAITNSNDGNTRIASSTFLNNTNSEGAETIRNEAGIGTVQIQNSVIMNYLSTANGNSSINCTGTITDLGFNIEFNLQNPGDNNCFVDVPGNPGLQGATLALNGSSSPAQTIALTTANTALVDQGNPDGCTDVLGSVLSLDQRGSARHVSGDGVFDANDPRCDIGAFELEGCGDGVLQDNLNEECDDGNNVETDACRNSCIAATCGDGIVEAGVEGCDDGNLVDTDNCRNNCSLASCGDGTKDSEEECDDGNEINTDACKNTCTAAICGDGVVETGVEECDDQNAIDTDACKNDCTVAVAAPIYLEGSGCSLNEAIQPSLSLFSLLFTGTAPLIFIYQRKRRFYTHPE